MSGRKTLVGRFEPLQPPSLSNSDIRKFILHRKVCFSSERSEAQRRPAPELWVFKIVPSESFRKHVPPPVRFFVGCLMNSESLRISRGENLLFIFVHTLVRTAPVLLAGAARRPHSRPYVTVCLSVSETRESRRKIYEGFSQLSEGTLARVREGICNSNHNQSSSTRQTRASSPKPSRRRAVGTECGDKSIGESQHYLFSLLARSLASMVHRSIAFV